MSPMGTVLARRGCLEHHEFPTSGWQEADEAQLAWVVLPKLLLTSQEMSNNHLMLSACWYKV